MIDGPPVPRESNSDLRPSLRDECDHTPPPITSSRTSSGILQPGSRPRAVERSGSGRSAVERSLGLLVTRESSMPPLPVRTTASPSSRDIMTSPNSDVALTGARTLPSLMTPCLRRHLSGANRPISAVDRPHRVVDRDTHLGRDRDAQVELHGRDRLASAIREANLATEIADGRSRSSSHPPRDTGPSGTVLPGTPGPSATRRPRSAPRPIGCRRSGVLRLLPPGHSRGRSPRPRPSARCRARARRGRRGSRMRSVFSPLTGKDLDDASRHFVRDGASFRAWRRVGLGRRRRSDRRAETRSVAAWQ